MNASGSIKPPRVLKIVKIGNSMGVILPKEVLTHMGVALGDIIDVVDHPDGVAIRRHDAGFSEQMEAARGVMQRRRAALRELAK